MCSTGDPAGLLVVHQHGAPVGARHVENDDDDRAHVVPDPRDSGRGVAHRAHEHPAGSGLGEVSEEVVLRVVGGSARHEVV